MFVYRYWIRWDDTEFRSDDLEEVVMRMRERLGVLYIFSTESYRYWEYEMFPEEELTEDERESLIEFL